ncbi:hypothetical protein GmHk_02G005306 [Glycine max]|nr:hypothetical protein GmHk_02G005306 [Glycine max]
MMYGAFQELSIKKEIPSSSLGFSLNVIKSLQSNGSEKHACILCNFRILMSNTNDKISVWTVAREIQTQKHSPLAYLS